MISSWFVTNGMLALHLSDAEKLFPTLTELYSQKDGNAYLVGDRTYPLPTDVLNVRFSALPLNVEVLVEKCGAEMSFQVFIVAIKKGCRYDAPRTQRGYLGYVLIDDVVYPLGGDFLTVSELLSEVCQGREWLSLREYISLRRALEDRGVRYVDNAANTIAEEKNKSWPSVADGLVGSLYPYQASGCRWLTFMAENGCGCILGDEMGLGKTLQVIVMLGEMKKRLIHFHALIVCPVSLLENWRREIAKFYPSLRVCVHLGSGRTGYYGDLMGFDVVIVSYGNALSDLGMLNMIEWDVAVLDEAQYIKNPDAKRTRGLKHLRRMISVAVTGTPMENHMSDIWSIVDFVMPGYLGTLHQYESMYGDDVASAARVERFLSPIMIRRRVADVAFDLPSRVDIPVAIEMTEDEAGYYEGKRREVAVEDLRSMRLETIQALRMFCTHPMVYRPDISTDDLASVSNKYQRLCEILEEIFVRNEKVLIFTSFNEMIRLLICDIKKRFKVYVDFINGSVNAGERQGIIDRFAEFHGAGVLVLNPKAAGTGLNITCANHVVHYNLEWNPAVEDQASARAYRRGQDKNVFVYRLYYANTIEDVINDKIQRKREMAAAAVVGNTGENLDSEYLAKALRISPCRNVEV